MEENDNVTIKINKNSLWKYSTFFLLALIVVGAFVFYFNNNSSGTTGNVANTNTGNLPAATGKVEIRDSDPSIGDANAPVTIVEFSDFSCPYCGAASGDSEEYVAYMKSRSSGWEPAIPGIMKDYVETGKVRLVFKYFPGHGSGQQAQLVGWCLNDQGLFWKFHNLAFANQADTNDLAKMKSLAQQVGADMTKLDKCLSDKKYDSKLNSDTSDGQTAGVQGTPAFFINGKLVSGAQPYSVFKQAIDAELG